jgi:uncharacterized membrane protein
VANLKTIKREVAMEFIFLVNIGIGLLIIGLAIPLVKEKIKPNIWYGFRTKKTLSDEKIWYPANKYAGQKMICAGTAIVLLSALSFLLMFFGVMVVTSQVVIMTIWVLVLMIPTIGMSVASMMYLKKL